MSYIEKQKWNTTLQMASIQLKWNSQMAWSPKQVARQKRSLDTLINIEDDLYFDDEELGPKDVNNIGVSKIAEEMVRDDLKLSGDGRGLPKSKGRGWRFTSRR